MKFHVKIGPYTYKVTSKKMENDFGVLDRERLTIEISPDAAHEVQILTMIHELLHAALFSAGIGFLTTNQEEAIVDGLAGQIVMFLRENPKFIHHLGNMLKKKRPAKKRRANKVE